MCKDKLKETENNIINQQSISLSKPSTDIDTALSDTPDKKERSLRILELSDRMLEKISRAIDEIDICTIRDKVKTKEVEYDSELKKPVRETYSEKETVSLQHSTVDTGALRQLVSTLKDIRDIQFGICSPCDEEVGQNGVIVIADILKEGEK
ncbi:MAG: hypothetical protein II998_12870 [Clostridia bacterium]|nr:hypothetical protein [Clostridia bacterium]